MLQPEYDLRPFYRSVKAIPWLDAIATRMRGIKPPRYPTLWEAIVNAIIFQQVSIHAASAILRRVVEHLTKPIEHQGRKYHPFFTPEDWLAAKSKQLRSLGISEGNVDERSAAAPDRAAWHRAMDGRRDLLAWTRAARCLSDGRFGRCARAQRSFRRSERQRRADTRRTRRSTRDVVLPSVARTARVERTT
jgi:hypothetical protein